MNFTILIFLISSLYFPQSVFTKNNITSTDSLDAFLLNSAFNTLIRHRPRTGALYTALLPSDLSGINASIVRLRSRRLWNVGANFTHFQIPPKTKTIPHVKRLAIVYQDLGNWSSHYYNIPGYAMVTPVVGFEVFNASRGKSVQRIGLDTRGRRIVIRFSNLRFFGGGAKKCVAFSFGENGGFRLDEVSEENVCYARDEGRFAIVVETKGGGGPRGKKVWLVWVLGGFVIGFGGIFLGVFYGMMCKKFVKSKKIEVMEKQAEEDSVLETMWVGSSKMPCATVTRTQPNIESSDGSRIH
ncbi:uncharacterized protein [Euphorbia lathyris]|uniref:uncharacterized protein n=1 Tax=Euphorbia lathyris TaxID=212925 RepID=UPI0033131B12